MSKLPCANTMIFKKYPPLKSGPPEISVIQREFRTNEGTTDYATIPEVTLSGDFVIECSVLASLSGGSVFYGLLGSEISTAAERAYSLVLKDDGQVLFIFGNGAAFQPVGTVAGVVETNKLTTIRVTRIGNLIKIYVNGIESASSTVSGFPANPTNRIYSYIGGSYLSGILANLKIYDAGTLVRNYLINDGKNILANAATALGNEIDGLTYALTTAIGGVASVLLTSLSVIGKTYLVEVSYSGVVGDASVRIGGFSGPSFTGTGSHSFVATAITTVNDILGALTGVTSGSVTVSIKEAEGYGTIINGNADDWGLFDRQANGDWLGQELVVNGGFEYDISNWTAFNSVISHHPNSIRVDDSANAGNNSRAYQDIAITNGIKCRFKFSQYPVSDGSSSYVGVIGSNFPRLSRGGNGDYSEDIEIVSGASIHLTVNGTSIVDFSKVSLKEVLKNA